MTVLLELDQVTVRLGGRTILDRLSWQLHDGECAVLLGPSGGGKSVFLRTLLGFQAPDAGTVGAPGLHPGPGMGAASLFSSVAVLFQDDALFDERTIEANLAMAAEERADLFSGPFAPETETAIDAGLREVGLVPERVRRQLPAALSGGMRRRVALARALIRRPRVLIADEPTSGLDPASSDRIYDLIGSLLAARGMSAIIVTHDPHCASRLGFPVYYFSPVEGRMPRWPVPPPETDPDERHRLLLGWMREQIAGHASRQAAEAEADRGDPRPRLTPTELGDRLFIALGRLGLLVSQIASRPSLALTVRHLGAWGLGSVPLLALIFLMLGIVMQVQAEAAVVEYGLSNRLPELVALSMLRLSPILTGFLLAGRCGSALAAHFGWLSLGGQLRAMETMRIDPDRTLFPPLFWSLALVTPLLTLLGIAIGGFGALLALGSPVSLARITPSFFMQNFPQFITLAEVLIVILKGLLMGGGLALLAYSRGAAAKRSPAQVSSAITRTLVAGFVWCTLVDSLVSVLLSP